MRPEAPRFVCAGNWIVDIVHDIDHWPDKSNLARIRHATRGIGGGAANVSFCLKALDASLDIVPVGRVGDDEFARYVIAECENAGLPTSHLLETPGTPTAHTHVMNLAGDSRTFFYHGGANDVLDRADVPLGELLSTPRRGIFYFGYLMLLARFDALGDDRRTQAADLLRDVQANGFLTCVDLVSANHDDFTASVSACLPHIDYLIINEVEAGRVLDTAIKDDRTMTEACRRLLDQGVNKAVIIHTAEQAVWIDVSGARYQQPAYQVDVCDIASPVGAGDAFCSGVLYGVAHAYAPEKSMALGHRMASESLKSMTATGGIPSIASLIDKGLF